FSLPFSLLCIVWSQVWRMAKVERRHACLAEILHLLDLLFFYQYRVSSGAGVVTSTPARKPPPPRLLQKLRPGIISYTPASTEGVWEFQRRKGRRSSPPPPLPDFTTSNRFESLSSLSSPGAPSSLENVLVIGDSIVRHLKPAPARGSASVSCFPGARVEEIARRIPAALRENKSIGTVIVHAGVNDMPARRSEMLKKHFESLAETVKKTTSTTKLVFSGPLPTYRRGSEVFSRLSGLNSFLKNWCMKNHFGFIDNWDHFWERPAFYRRDGLHPSRKGSQVLSDNITAFLHQV
uniref:SGNH hydrolase-type esterase domain-containing protein n=1 Tax=Astyanax mexicanus TaxID=7994 RepID=A0A3B1IQ98_ASTMX